MTKKHLALVVDVDRDLENAFERDGFEVVTATAAEATGVVDERDPRVLVLGQRVPHADAKRLVKGLPHSCASFLIVNGYTPDALARSLEVGVDAFIQAGVSQEELMRVVRQELQGRERASHERESLDVRPMVGSSEPMQNLCKMLAKTAPSKVPVLITGESGTGKELVARSVHRLSPRRNGPFIAVNCGAIPENLIESELFGHEKGAFTGATERKIGRFEAANGGTLFLDEIGELPLNMQVKLLRVLQDKRFERVGGNKPIEVDVRLLFATNRNLEDEVEAGRFRADLYYRIDVLRIEVPPLRRRKSDIELLWEHFVRQAAEEEGRTGLETRPDVVRLLMRYDWPGNVRELENVARQAVIRRSSGKITPRIIRDRLGGMDEDSSAPEVVGDTALRSLEEIERDAIIRTYRAVDSIKEAADILGISERKMYYRLKQYREQGWLEEEGARPSRDRPRIVFAHGKREAFGAVESGLHEKFDAIWVQDGMGLLNEVYESSPDAIVVQAALPVLDGLNVLELGYEHGWKMPVVLLGSADDYTTREYAEALGAAAFLDEPVDPNQLSWVIETALTVRTA